MSYQHQRANTAERFAFGENWRMFLHALNEDRITEAEHSLQQTLGMKNLHGKSFLDVGSGSGLFSLAAWRLGAHVHSFDYDEQAVQCTFELRRKYAPTSASDRSWAIEQGSALDAEYLRSLGTFDIVYSWGVLHHTGHMWRALENVQIPVVPGGTLLISIYNDQGKTSYRWHWVKQKYNQLPPRFRFLILWPVVWQLWWRNMVSDLLHRRPFHTWRSYGKQRGMSAWRDAVDWAGGYPFEVATPEQIFSFFQRHGFALDKLKTCGGGHGCNEFVFCRQVDAGGESQHAMQAASLLTAAGYERPRNCDALPSDVRIR